jgi:hypothetical protein
VWSVPPIAAVIWPARPPFPLWNMTVMTMVVLGVPVLGETVAADSWILDGAADIGAAMMASRNIAVAMAAIHGHARWAAR